MFIQKQFFQKAVQRRPATKGQKSQIIVTLQWTNFQIFTTRSTTACQTTTKSSTTTSTATTSTVDLNQEGQSKIFNNRATSSIKQQYTVGHFQSKICNISDLFCKFCSSRVFCRWDLKNVEPKARLFLCQTLKKTVFWWKPFYVRTKFWEHITFFCQDSTFLKARGLENSCLLH